MKTYQINYDKNALKWRVINKDWGNYILVDELRNSGLVKFVNNQETYYHCGVEMTRFNAAVEVEGDLEVLTLENGKTIAIID